MLVSGARNAFRNSAPSQVLDLRDGRSAGRGGGGSHLHRIRAHGVCDQSGRGPERPLFRRPHCARMLLRAQQVSRLPSRGPALIARDGSRPCARLECVMHGRCDVLRSALIARHVDWSARVKARTVARHLSVRHKERRQFRKHTTLSACDAWSWDFITAKLTKLNPNPKFG